MTEKLSNFNDEQKQSGALVYVDIYVKVITRTILALQPTGMMVLYHTLDFGNAIFFSIGKSPYACQLVVTSKSRPCSFSPDFRIFCLIFQAINM